MRVGRWMRDFQWCSYPVFEAYQTENATDA